MAERQQAGFSLVEVMVALGLIGVAVAALLTVQAQSARSLSALEARLLADIVAENRMVEIALGGLPDGGAASGTERLAGRLWRWQLRVRETGEPELRRVEIDVRADTGDTVLASLAALRRR